MSYKQLLFVCATLICLKFVKVSGQNGSTTKLPSTRFTCVGKVSGYYADVDTGCQVYHMCDGLGRQFSYKCPNMTLFQQRMLICDHWYMVNCSMSERDYDANLLIGQRDKPFVSDDEMRLRTPRPDILSVPPYNPYFDVLRTDAKLPDVEDNDLDTRQSKSHIKPLTFSAGLNKNRRQDTIDIFGPNNDNLDQAASQEPLPTFRPTPIPKLQQDDIPTIPPPLIELVPPVIPENSKDDSATDESAGPAQDAVFQFIKRFDPTSPEIVFQKTAMSTSEILDLNAHLPDGQVSSEEERTPRKHKNSGNKLNTIRSDNDKSFTVGTKVDSVNTKSKPSEETLPKGSQRSNISEPEKELVPPKTFSEPIPTTTVGPPIYYEWRWAVPAFDLIPPSETKNNGTNTTKEPQSRSVTKFEGKNPFSTVTRPTPITTSPQPSQIEYNISSYFVPDYVFPLDNAHPGYESKDAQTSFQVKVASPGMKSFGESLECPQCHPAYLVPGTCQPCFLKR